MKSASVLRQLWQNIINIRLSRATVNRRGLKACRPVQRPRLNDLRKQRRFLWAHQHSRYGLRHWRHVIYTDESRFLLHRSDGRVRVKRQQGKRFREDCVVGTVMAGGGSVHVWGGIHHGGKTLTWLCYTILSTATDIDLDTPNTDDFSPYCCTNKIDKR